MINIIVVSDQSETVKFIYKYIKIEGGFLCKHFMFDEIQYIDKSNYDLAIIDFNFPQQFVEEFQAICTVKCKVNVPILLISGQSNTREKLFAFYTGVDDYIERPINIAEFNEVVQNLLRRKRILARYNIDKIVEF